MLTDPAMDTQLFYTRNGASGSSVLRLDLNSVTSAVIDLQSLYSTTQTLGDIAIDTSSGLYFFIQSQGTVNEGKLSQPNVIQTFAVQFSEVSLAIDPSRGNLYDGFLDVAAFFYQRAYLLTPAVSHMFSDSSGILARGMAFDPVGQQIFAIEKFYDELYVVDATGYFLSAFNPGGLTSVAYAPSVNFFLVSEPALVFTQEAINGHAGAVLLY